jgi:hypothetical protein
LLSYYPAAGDLLYPEMFLMMKDIETKQAKTQFPNSQENPTSKSSAIDQHNLWYPVRT